MASTLLVSLLCLSGCASHKMLNNVPQTIDSADNSKIVDSAKSARLIAIQKFNESGGRGHHLKYKITVKEESEKWIVFFTSKSLMPIIGDHAMVWIDKTTGEIKLHHGL